MLWKSSLAVAFMLASGSVSHAAMIGVKFFGQTVCQINAATGAVSDEHPDGFFYSDIAAAPDGRLFALTNAGPNGSGAQLRIVDASTGNSTLVGSIGLIAFAEGDMAFSPSGELFAHGGNNQLIKINTTTGASTLIGMSSGVDDISGLFFVGQDLYGIDPRTNTGASTGAVGNLIKLNPATAAVISSVPLDKNFGGPLAAADVDPMTGVVYVAGGGPGLNNLDGVLYTLDVATAKLTMISSSEDLAGISGITFASLPEPATAAVAASWIGLALRRRRLD